MPAGVSWATFLKTFAASLLTMCAEAKGVQRYHRLDLTILEIPPKVCKLQEGRGRILREKENL
uniref:Secreted protein n=1 Tax=Canis lupus familiaris TaxID=9615 RepID=A0A8I3S1K0_CANLF